MKQRTTRARMTLDVVLVPAQLRPADEPTEYEKAEAVLGSKELAVWVRRNCNRCYIPESVLRAAGLSSYWQDR